MVKNINYLISHYKGVYRLKTEYDKKSKQFPREYDGRFAENDVYIDCHNKLRIYYYGNRILECYIPSKLRGRNIIKAIQDELGNEILFHIEETDSEILFRFNSKYMTDLEIYLKPKTSGADISPFSNRNLLKSKYFIPDDDLHRYNNIIAKLPQNKIILLAKYASNFIRSLENKNNTWENIKADMALRGLKGKEYIHSIGKWAEYINYLKVNIMEDS